MKITLKQFFNPPSKENYIKNSSAIVTFLIILGGLLYHKTNGYGTAITLVLALIVMLFQKILIIQTNKYFHDMYQAKEMYKKTKNKDYLLFIKLSIEKMAKEIKVLSEKAKREMKELEDYTGKYI